MQPHENQRRQDHDRGRIQHATDSSLAYSNGRSLLALAEWLVFHLTRVHALLLLVGQDGEHGDAVLDFLAAHQEDVQHTSEGDGSEGDEAAGDELGIGREALEARDCGVETVCDTARRADSEEVRLGNGRCGERGGFVRVGVVDGNVERLVGYLPAERSCCLLSVSLQTALPLASCIP